MDLIEKYLGEINYNKISKDAEKLHQKAAKYTNKQKFKVGKDTYYIEFDSREGIFIITGGEFDEYPQRYNTRKINQAKKWFKEYLGS